VRNGISFRPDFWMPISSSHEPLYYIFHAHLNCLHPFVLVSSFSFLVRSPSKILFAFLLLLGAAPPYDIVDGHQCRGAVYGRRWPGAVTLVRRDTMRWYLTRVPSLAAPAS
jgi:hypothetical protein